MHEITLRRPSSGHIWSSLGSPSRYEDIAMGRYVGHALENHVLFVYNPYGIPAEYRGCYQLLHPEQPGRLAARLFLSRPQV
jgi:hypothetical protein